MYYLLAASLIWAFSFGLIKHVLVGHGLDPFFVAFIRLGLSAVAFAPLLRVRGLAAPRLAQLAALGAVQYGLMYMAYMWSYTYLDAYEVALFTVFTPLYVAVGACLASRRFRAQTVAAAVAAIVGTIILIWNRPERGPALIGIGLVQVANICFAAGQVWYRRLMAAIQADAAVRGTDAPRDYAVFAVLYAGAALVAALPVVLRGMGETATFGGAQAVTLLYLGLVPSALGFYLWNAGARRTRVGALAAMNNAKVPLAIGVSLLVFHETADLVRLVLGAAMLIAAVVWGGRRAEGEP